MKTSKQSYKINQDDPVKAPLFCSLRLTLAFLAALGFFLCYAQRNGLSVSIVCMVNSEADNQTNPLVDSESVATDVNIPTACQMHGTQKNRTAGQVLMWPKETRGVILGSFYWGYALTQVLSSFVVNLLGARRFLGLLIFVSSTATLLIPIFSQFSAWLVIFLRIVVGAAQGGLWPTIFRFWASWAPITERTTLLSFQSAGPSLGTIFSLAIGGVFCSFFLNDGILFILRFGWAFFFYLLGGLGILWSAAWLFIASDSPDKNRHITENEKKFIRHCKKEEKIQDSNAVKIPWGPMLRSQGFWCILFSMFFCDFGLYAIWSVVPEYMNEVLRFSITENGFLSALPHAASFIVVILTGRLADIIIEKKYLERVNARKLFHGIGTLSPAICLLLISFLDCQNRYIAVILLTIGVALNGFMMSGGYVVNVGDFSGVHSGFVFGICNTVSCIGGFCAPYLTSIITRNKTAQQWRLVFMIYAGSFFMSAVVFILLARGETEAWAQSDVRQEKIQSNGDEDRELINIDNKTKQSENPNV